MFRVVPLNGLLPASGTDRVRVHLIDKLSVTSNSPIPVLWRGFPAHPRTPAFPAPSATRVAATRSP